MAIASTITIALIQTRNFSSWSQTGLTQPNSGHLLNVSAKDITISTATSGM